MRALSSLGLLFALALPATVHASETDELLALINAYRAEAPACEKAQPGAELPPLRPDPRLQLSLIGGDLEGEISRSGYPMVNVRSLSLSGPRDAAAAMDSLKLGFCRFLLDPQFVDIGISQAGRDWRIVLGRPLLTGRLGEWQSEGEKLLALVNQARGTARRCGDRTFEAAPPLNWNATLGSTAHAHSRAMANGNFFAHRDADGLIPGDRVELAGYSASAVGENIAAALDTPQLVLDAWLASPGHCATLMNPQYRDAGLAYAADPASDGGIYWTALFAAP